MAMQWAKLLVMHWPTCSWVRSDQDVNDAADEIRQKFGRNSPSNDELCAAIRWLAGPENRQERQPSLRELIRAVAIMRKADREHQDGPAPQCGLCGNRGWVTYCPDLKPPYTILGMMLAYSYSVPCRCPIGDRQPTAKTAETVKRINDAEWARMLSQRRAWDAEANAGPDLAPMSAGEICAAVSGRWRERGAS